MPFQQNKEARHAVLYSRVSTNHQVQDGVSLEAQESRLHAWAEAHGLDVIEHCVDKGLSGKRADNREGVIRAVDLACERSAVLVVYSLSRLARSVMDTILIADRLSKSGANLVSLTEEINTTSASGKLVFRILSVLAQFESDICSERTRAALAHKRSQGQKTGGRVPFGYREVDKALVEIPQEQEALCKAAMWKAEGRSLRWISEELVTRAYTERPFNPGTLSRILNRHKERQAREESVADRPNGNRTDTEPPVKTLQQC